MTQQLKQRKIDFTSFCRFFNVTKEEAEEHLRSHDMSEFAIVDDDKRDSAIDYYNKFKTILDHLEKWINVVVSSGKYDKSAVLNLTTLVKEYRQALMNLAELEGKIQRGQTIVQIQQYNQKLDELVEIVLNEVCDRCRERILARLETMLNI